MNPLTDFENVVTDLLKTNEAYLDNEKQLDPNKVCNAAVKHDEDLIKLLLSNPKTKEHFFVSVGDTLIFKVDNFQFFVSDKKFYPYGYSQFTNKIGLKIGNKFLNQRNEVALAWQYKDGLLEGGMTKEDVKKDELFFNTILDKTEIDRLLDPKVFTNSKRYTANGTEEVTTYNPDDNLIIKGNNLIALHTLKKNYKGKIKLIYIDPPYNTGNDGFKYNDSFNHSTWLTFMKNRLEVAKELLKDDGVIFVQCDDNEQAYLKILMDEIFKRENFVANIIWKKKGNPSNTEKNIGTITESIILFCKDIRQLIPNLQNYNRKYSFIENGKEFNLEFPVKTNEGAYERTTMMFEIHTPEGVFLPPKGKRWTLGELSMKKIVKEKKYVIENGKFKIKKFYDDYLRGDSKLFNNLFLEQGSLKLAKDELNNLGFERELFDTPKPELLIKAIVEMITSETDIILDFHLGSGTTAAVAHKMNRRYIGIEQMDYIETVAVERLKKVVAGEQGGISKAVNWQSGGSFVYTELATYNQTFIDEIAKAKTNKELLKIWNDIKEKGFLDYKVETKNFDEQEFSALSINEQKDILFKCLDVNQLYVPYSEINDKQFSISEKDKKFNQSYYEGK